MKKSEQIIILKAKIIKLKEKLKAARLELADRDNEKSFERTNLFTYFTPEVIDEIKQRVEKKIEADLRCNPIEPIKRFENQPTIESTQELFKSTMQKVMDENTKDNSGAFIRETTNQKGYVYYNLSNNHKCYAVGITDKNQEVLWDDRKEQAKIYNSFEEFQNEYKDVKSKSITPIFEPITPPLTPPTKENINYCHGG